MGENTNTRLLLLRHGRTSHNQNGIMQGQLYTQLDTLGIAQANALANFLQNSDSHKVKVTHATKAYSSDLSRAKQTATIVCQKLNIDTNTLKLTHALRERHLGPFQGFTEAQAKRLFPQRWMQFLTGKAVDGVETSRQVEARAGAIMHEIAAAHVGQTVLVFSHGGTIHSAVKELTTAQHVPHIGNCSITELFAVKDGPSFTWRVGVVGADSGTASGGSNVDVR